MLDIIILVVLLGIAIFYWHSWVYLLFTVPLTLFLPLFNDLIVDFLFYSVFAMIFLTSGGIYLIGGAFIGLLMSGQVRPDPNKKYFPD